MSDEMSDKYQQHYNQILSGTLTDNILKSISLQANIKLANDIISEQEKTIVDLEKRLEEIGNNSSSKVESLQQEIELLRNNRASSENLRINSLETTIKNQLETINRLNNEVTAANKLKIEFDVVKNQANNVDVFRKELVKERENHAATKQQYENTIKELNEQIDLLKAPPKRKKPNKTSNILSLVDIENNTLDENVEEAIKDGGTF